jgi:hypothetical protein
MSIRNLIPATYHYAYNGNFGASRNQMEADCGISWTAEDITKFEKTHPFPETPDGTGCTFDSMKKQLLPKKKLPLKIKTYSEEQIAWVRLFIEDNTNHPA